MPLELTLEDNKTITEDDLVAIFRCFCQAFGIEVDEHDERFMRGSGLRWLDGPIGIDYRPCWGAKFFAQKSGTQLSFHGYAQPEDPEWEAKDKKFQELALEYFRKKQ